MVRRDGAIALHFFASELLQNPHQIAHDGGRNQIGQGQGAFSSPQLDGDTLEDAGDLTFFNLAIFQHRIELFGDGGVKVGVGEVQMPFGDVDVDIFADAGGQFFDRDGVAGHFETPVNDDDYPILLDSSLTSGDRPSLNLWWGIIESADPSDRESDFSLRL